MPELVRNEFIGQEIQSQIKAAEEALSKVRPVAKQVQQTEDRSALMSAVEVLEDIIKSASDRVPKETDSQFAEIGVQLLPLDPSACSGVFDAYFAGTPPFRGVRKRDDIPDAFIWECVVRAARHGPLAFLCHDGGFEPAVEKVQNISLLKSMLDLVASRECQELLTEENATDLLPQVAQFLTKQRAFFDQELGKALAQRQIGGRGFPSDSLQGIIVEVESIDDISVGDVDYFGDGQFSGEFNARITCLTTFDMTAENLYQLPLDARPKVDILDEDETFLIAQAEMISFLSGSVTITLDLEQLRALALEDIDVESFLVSGDLCLDTIDEISAVKLA